MQPNEVPQQNLDSDQAREQEQIQKIAQYERELNTEEMKGHIDTRTKEELDNLQSKYESTLSELMNGDFGERNSDGWSKKVQEVGKTILYILKLKQLKGEISLKKGEAQGEQNEIKIGDITDGNFLLQQLKDIFGENGEFEFNKCFGNEYSGLVSTYIKGVLGWNNNEKQNYEAQEGIRNNKSALVEDYFAKLANNQGVAERFKELRNLVTKDKGMEQAFCGKIKSLLNVCYPDEKKVDAVSFDKGTFKSQQIQDFQDYILGLTDEEATVDGHQEGQKVNLKNVLSDGMKKSAADGLLGGNTLSALILLANSKLLKDPGEKSKGAKFQEGTGRIEGNYGGDKIEEMPLTAGPLNALGVFIKEGNHVKFRFHGEEDHVEKGDLVKRDPQTNREYLVVGEEKYYISDAKSGERGVRQTYVDESYLDYNGNTVILPRTKIELGKFDSNGNMEEGTTILVDGNGKEILTETKSAPKERQGARDEKPVSEQLGTVVKEGGWRNVLFDEKGESTDRFSEKQLDRLDLQDISMILEQAIQAYREIENKPDLPGRYNLNHIVYSIIKESNLIQSFGGLDDRKNVVHYFLGLDSGFFSNPQKNIGESDKKSYASINPEVILRVETNNQAKEDETTKLGRIINRLNTLKSYVESDAFKDIHEAYQNLSIEHKFSDKQLAAIKEDPQQMKTIMEAGILMIGQYKGELPKKALYNLTQILSIAISETGRNPISYKGLMRSFKDAAGRAEVQKKTVSDILNWYTQEVQKKEQSQGSN